MTKQYDVLVVGSGATGSIAVKELTERGLDVLLLEAGPDLSETDFPPMTSEPTPMGIGVTPRLRDAMRGQYVQARRGFFSASASHFLVNDRHNPYAVRRGQPFLWIRARVLGGRLHVYGRMLLRMSTCDFAGGTSGEMWPISYEELVPWYERIEDFVGLYGNSDGLQQLPDGRYRGPGYLTAAEQDFKRTVEYRWPDRSVVSWRYAAPNLHRVPLGILAARNTGRLTTRTDAVVTRLRVNDKTGRVDGAYFVDRLKMQEQQVSADVVVLCASTIESVRLLLNSRSARHPNGLANSSGLLGQYFMDQAPSLTFGASTHRKGWELDATAEDDPCYPPAGGFYVPRVESGDGPMSTQLSRRASFQGTIGRIPVPDDNPAVFGMMGFSEMRPYKTNAISLDRTRTDRWGVPVARIDVRLGDTERAVLAEQVQFAREIAENAGYRLKFNGSSLGLDSRAVWPDANPASRAIFRLGFKRSLAIGAAIHECGGARMGSDPATSVLNEFNQSWDIPNLFVTDASCYVSNSIVGPTLTIMALTARACAHIAREHASGGGLTAREASPW